MRGQVGLVQLFGAGGPEAFAGVVERPDIEVAYSVSQHIDELVRWQKCSKGIGGARCLHTDLRSVGSADPHDRLSWCFPRFTRANWKDERLD